MEQKGTTLQPKDESGKNDTNEAPSLGEYKDNPLAAATGSMKQDIVTTDKKFKYPQVLRANLAWEQFLPGDVKMTLEGVYSKTMIMYSSRILLLWKRTGVCRSGCRGFRFSFL